MDIEVGQVYKHATERFWWFKVSERIGDTWTLIHLRSQNEYQIKDSVFKRNISDGKAVLVKKEAGNAILKFSGMLTDTLPVSRLETVD